MEEDAEIVEEQEGRAFHAVHLRHRDRRFQECYIGAPAGLVQPYQVWCGPEPDLGYPVADIDTSDLAADASGHVPQDREESVPVKTEKRCPVIDSGRGLPSGLDGHGAVRGGRRGSAALIVDEFRAVFAIVQLEQVRLRVKPADVS